MAPPPFPNLKPKSNLTLNAILPSQIYTVDDFLSATEIKAIRTWIEGVVMEEPKPPGKGEAERTARRGSINSPDIASIVLRMLLPYIPLLSPLYKSSSPALSPNIRIYHYPRQTYFRCHYDSPTLDPTSKRLSCWTILIYLSDCTGGGTTFHLSTHDTGSANKKKNKPNAITKKADNAEGEKVTVEPKAGRLLLHWHGMSGGGCLKHEGKEVEQGDKWVFRTDILA
ncbi:uncharacterized protein IL334_006807 [Kwoniella shivajii]|uniref:Fe2OG dioxygenase domain-containing protein n=1 Tax=Kwoniella shivajii TaxID=564305 RepID=A0ABZ1DA07_9TREE|nr:hypothetical protein IL334_006807 [Kwoniella shivajii]